jgi:hypothetical protein
MQKATEYKVEDSNVENIGSAEDKAARLAAAQTEKEWCVFAAPPVEKDGQAESPRTAEMGNCRLPPVPGLSSPCRR